MQLCVLAIMHQRAHERVVREVLLQFGEHARSHMDFECAHQDHAAIRTIICANVAQIPERLHENRNKVFAFFVMVWVMPGSPKKQLCSHTSRFSDCLTLPNITTSFSYQLISYFIENCSESVKRCMNSVINRINGLANH